jgi:pimeloyl-ACP methyl ester carboxylesterase
MFEHSFTFGAHEARRKLHVIAGGPHGINVSHADEFNDALLEFLGEDFTAPVESRT